MPQPHTSSRENDIYGQYATDRILHPDAKPDTTGTVDMRGDGDFGFHQGAVLFDHVDRTPDAATGEVRQEHPEAQFTEVGLRIGALPVQRALGHDEAEEWLQENDPQYNDKRWL